MLRSIDGLAVRQLRTRPLRAALTAFGVVLGVGMVFGVLVLVGTIRATFDDLIDSAWGKTDLIVTAEGNGVLPGSARARVSDVEGVRDVAPMAGGDFIRLDARRRPIEGAKGSMLVAGYETKGVAPYDFRWVAGREPSSGPELAVERNWARDRGIAVGDRIRVATSTGRTVLPVVGIFKFSSGLSFGGRGFAAMPIEAIRPLIDVPSGYHQISVVVDDADDVEATQRRLEEQIAGIQVTTPEGFSDDVKQQLAGLNIVLYFFSGVALFVGGFLILNSFNMTVLQRMREIGTLRTLGASRHLVTRTILTEALAIGIVGSILGLGLGIGLAAGLIALMRGLEMPVGELQVSATPAIVAFAVGMLVTAAGALWPARRAGRVSPISAVLGNRGVRKAPRRSRLLIGLALAVPGAVLGGEFWGGDNSGSAMSGIYGIGLTMAMFAGMALMAPFVIMPVIRALAVPLRKARPAGGRLAADSLVSNAARTAATAAALTIGLSVVVVNASMSSSFMGTLSDQIHANFARDFTVQATGRTLADGGGPGVPKGFADELAAMPETRAVSPVRAVLLEVPEIDQGPKNGIAIGYDPAVWGLMDATPIRDRDRSDALRDVAAGGVLIGADYAAKAHLDAGDELPLSGPGGAVDAPIAGVLDAAGTFAGYEIQMSLKSMRDIYRVTSDAQVAVRARSEQAAPALQRRIEALIGREHAAVEIESVAERQKAINDQVSAQFNMFNSIVAIAVVVSLLGVINTLAMSVLERTREIGVLRALGSTRWQIGRTMVDESLLITSAGAITGVLFGLIVGVLWIRGFDTVMPGLTFHLPAATVIAVAIAAVVLGTLAAILPARRAARQNVLDALSYE